MMFKGTQFWSGGVWMAVCGGVQYYACVHDNQRHSCNKSGPGSSMGFVMGTVDLLGSSLCVWMAFIFLPYSKKSAGLRMRKKGDLTEPIEVQEDSASEVEDDSVDIRHFCGWRYFRGRG